MSLCGLYNAVVFCLWIADLSGLNLQQSCKCYNIISSYCYAVHSIAAVYYRKLVYIHLFSHFITVLQVA